MQRKKACDRARPCCFQCERRSLNCIYAKSEPQFNEGSSLDSENRVIDSDTIYALNGMAEEAFPLGTLEEMDWTDFDAFALFTQDSTFNSLIYEQGSLPERQKYNLRFLHSFTQDNGFIESFDCGTASQRLEVLEALQVQRLPAAPLAKDALAEKSSEILRLIREVFQVRPRNSPVTTPWSEDVRKACEAFFSPQRLRVYIGLYWAVWHPNVNFMHRPTFDPSVVKAAVVASMAIIGACVSPDARDNDDAKPWFDSVEEMVFRDCDLYADPKSDLSFSSIDKLQALQAAYMVCLFQNWEGSYAGKRSVRRYRYSTVVAVSFIYR